MRVLSLLGTFGLHLNSFLAEYTFVGVVAVNPQETITPPLGIA